MSSASSAAAAAQKEKKKDRQVVTWCREEDDLLRKQIALHGTGNWTAIASQFKDKTSRQCRRRWYNYLNVESKKGGWSPEEDMLLFQAQKLLGNKWTEIAKVVSGRTDNAVKNRFTTLSKKRAMYESSPDKKEQSIGKRSGTAKESLLNSNGEKMPPIKQTRFESRDLKENAFTAKMLNAQQLNKDCQIRQPFSVLSMNKTNANDMNAACELSTNRPRPSPSDVSIKCRSNFIRRDDPKVATLLQQAELLSSLAEKVNTENTRQSMDDAWKCLQDYLNESEDDGTVISDDSKLNSLLCDLMDLLNDTSMKAKQLSRELSEQADLCEPSNCNSEMNWEVTSQISPLNNNIVSCNSHMEVRTSIVTAAEENIQSTEMVGEDAEGIHELEKQFASPVQTVPFVSSRNDIPSPQFTSSEKRLLNTLLGLTTPQATPGSSLQSCKVSLFNRFGS